MQTRDVFCGVTSRPEEWLLRQHMLPRASSSGEVLMVQRGPGLNLMGLETVMVNIAPLFLEKNGKNGNIFSQQERENEQICFSLLLMHSENEQWNLTNKTSHGHRT